MYSYFQSATLTITYLRFTVRVITPLELHPFSGSSLRGSFFNALWQRFCTNKQAQSCAECPLHAICPVSTIVAPLREDHSWGKDIPRPYVVVPPLEGARHYQPSERFTLGLTLFGNVIQLLPYIMMSIPEIENAGLGRRLDENQGQRGHFKVERVETWNPFTEQGQAIYEAGSSSIYVPGTNITITQCLQYAEQLNKERITLQFLTPLRLIDHENLVTQIRFRPLIQRLLERYLALERHYGNPNLFLEREERSALLQQAETITCTIDQTHWQELRSYSNRQKRATAIGGLIGLATFEGNLQPFLGLLTIGELVHVGKSAVKGNGWYRIHP